MIKLFRKIRQSLLTENKFRKYFAYAIGEIFLVVVGILIAVQINTWKTERNNHSNLVQDIGTMESELYTNGYYLNDLYHELNGLQREIDSLGKIDLPDTLRAKYFTAILSSPRHNLSDVAYNKILNQLEGSPDDFAKIFIAIRDVYVNNIIELERSFHRLNSSAQSNHEYWRDNYSWYAYRENIDTMLNHKKDYTNNYLYNNLLSHYRMAFSDYSKHVKRQVRDILTLRLQIKGIQINSFDLSPYYEEFGYTELNPILCQDMPKIGERSDLGNCYLFVYNNTQQPVEMIWMDHNNQEVHYRPVAPDRYQLHRTFCGHRWLYRYPDDRCEVYYVDDTQTYIVLE